MLGRLGTRTKEGSAHPSEDTPPQTEQELRQIERKTSKRPEGRLPDFLLLGAQKGGTGFLFRLLNRHPNVEPAVLKEVDFFSKHLNEGVDWYRSCFPVQAHKDGKPVWTWEGSPNYLFHPHAARRAAEVVPDARLIVLLRNPVDRAYSHYHHQVRMGHESLPSFEEALEAEEERLRGKRERMLADESYLPVEFLRFSYVGRGLYVDQIEEWHRYFDRDQLLVVKSEDFFDRTRDTLAKIVRFVGLPDWEPERTSRRRARKYTLEPMNPDTRERLEEYFESHNQRLYEYLGVDFGW